MARRGTYGRMSMRMPAPRRIATTLRVTPDQAVTPPAGGIWAADLLPASHVDRGTINGSTVLRSRVDCEFHLDPTLFAATIGRVYVGIYMAEDVIAATNAPGTGTAINAFQRRNLENWLYWRMIPWARLSVLGDVPEGPTASVVLDAAWTVSTKSKRRIRGPNQGPVLVVQPDGVVGITGLFYAATTTFLQS